jgi:hypothetical protein
MEHEFDIILRMNGTHQLKNCADINSMGKNVNIIVSNIKYMLNVVGRLVYVNTKLGQTASFSFLRNLFNYF